MGVVFYYKKLFANHQIAGTITVQSDRENAVGFAIATDDDSTLPTSTTYRLSVTDSGATSNSCDLTWDGSSVTLTNNNIGCSISTGNDAPTSYVIQGTMDLSSFTDGTISCTVTIV